MCGDDGGGNGEDPLVDKKGLNEGNKVGDSDGVKEDKNKGVNTGDETSDSEGDYNRYSPVNDLENIKGKCVDDGDKVGNTNSDNKGIKDSDKLDE